MDVFIYWGGLAERSDERWVDLLHLSLPARDSVKDQGILLEFAKMNGVNYSKAERGTGGLGAASFKRARTEVGRVTSPDALGVSHERGIVG